MINVLCFVDGVNKPKKHTKCMAKVNTLLKNEGHNVHLGYISLTGLEAQDKRGVNSMSEMVPGKRAWLIVYDDANPCKSYTNEDIRYYKEFVDLFSSRIKRRLYFEEILHELELA